MILCPVNEHARRHPDHTAILWANRRISYKDLNCYVQFSERALKKYGVKSGDRICVADDYSVEAVIVIMALWRLGAVVCPLNPRIPSATLSSMVQKIQGKVLLTSNREILNDKKFSDVLALDTFIQFDQQGQAEGEVKIEPNADALIIWTSGSSGDPKPALLTFGNVYASAQGVVQEIPLEKNDRWLLCLPLFHVAGIGVVMRTFIAGATVVILKQGEEVSLALGKYGVTHVSLVAQQFRRVLEASSASIKSLKCVLLGGAAIPPSLLREATAKKFPVSVSYGLTEMASTVAMGSCDMSARVLPGAEVSVRDGEICVRGPALFKGYLWGQSVIPTRTKDGWFATGDLGRLDNGNLIITGRRDRMFISGGENIQPEEIEQLLMAIQGIQEAVVLPIKDAEFGERPAAFLKFSQTPISCAEIKSKHIKSLLGQSLPKFKIPQQFYHWPGGAEGAIKTKRVHLARLLENPRKLSIIE